jgi:hypothetical protein
MRRAAQHNVRDPSPGQKLIRVGSNRAGVHVTGVRDNDCDDPAVDRVGIPNGIQSLFYRVVERGAVTGVELAGHGGRTDFVGVGGRMDATAKQANEYGVPEH